MDDVLARVRKRGAELLGEMQYEDVDRICYVRGPEGIQWLVPRFRLEGTWRSGDRLHFAARPSSWRRGVMAGPPMKMGVPGSWSCSRLIAALA